MLHGIRVDSSGDRQTISVVVVFEDTHTRTLNTHKTHIYTIQHMLGTQRHPWVHTYVQTRKLSSNNHWGQKYCGQPVDPVYGGCYSK